MSMQYSIKNKEIDTLNLVLFRRVHINQAQHTNETCL